MKFHLRIWHFMVAVVVAGAYFAAARYDAENSYSCTHIHIIPYMNWGFLFGALGLIAAEYRGIRPSTGLLLGMLFGPFGLLFYNRPGAAPDDQKGPTSKQGNL
ncbi:MAG: hypothetical protein U0800_24810 [Isosphaeraceae bacterium]